MLKNYFKITIRNILKHKLYSLVNILGFSIGMAACFLIIHYVSFETNYESHHENIDNIFRVTLQGFNGNELVMEDAEMYPLLPPLLKDKYPEVIEAVRLHDNESTTFKSGDQMHLQTKVYFSDPSLFSIFSFEKILGDPQKGLEDPWTVVLTESLAIKYFGNTDVLDKSLQVVTGGGLKDLKIVGVISDSPANTHIKFEAIVSYETLIQSGYEPSWNGNNEFCYLLMQPNTSVAEFNKKLDELIASDLEGKIEGEKFIAQKMADIHLYSDKTYEPETNGDAKSVYFMLVVAIFIITIAWVNYLNLASARAVERAKEVGIRKVVGSSRIFLIIQFIFESCLINLISLIFACGIAQIALPYFIELSGQDLSPIIYNSQYFWLLILLMFTIGSIVSGLYPALVLSSFKPVVVLKGKLSSSKHGYWLRQSLVVFQFMITVILIAGTFSVFNQLNFLRTQDLGIAMDQVLVVETPITLDTGKVRLNKMLVLKNKWENQANIKSVSSMDAIPGLSHSHLSSTSGVSIFGENEDQNNYTYYHFGVDASFIPTLNLQLVAGENFREKEDRGEHLIINEKACRLIGFKSPEDAIGKKIRFGGEATILGVIKNFHHHSLKVEVDPFIYWYRPYNSYLCINLNTSALKTTIQQVKADFKEIYKDSSFKYYFLDEKFNEQYAADIQFGKVFGLFASLAIFIACLGLFGLSSFTALQRTKEIGVRKVLGASVPTILLLLSKDYVKLLVIAIIIGVPIANYMITEWLNSFATRIDLHWWYFLPPILIVLIVAVIAVSGQSIKAATGNPVKALRYE